MQPMQCFATDFINAKNIFFAAAPQSAAQQAPAVCGIRAGPAREQTGEAAAYAGRQQLVTI